MAKLKPRTVLYRRKAQQKTDYKRRLKLLESRQLRLVIRFTNQKIIAQVVKFETKGDKVLVALDSSALKEAGWNYSFKNFPAAYLFGIMVAKEAVKKGHKDAILDTGFNSPLKKSKTYAFLKGVIDGGMNVPHGDKDIFPSEDMLSGKHINEYANAIKSNKQEYESKFSKYLGNNSAPDKIAEVFKNVKVKLIGK